MKLLEGVEIRVSPDWCSKRDGHRAFVRQALRDVPPEAAPDWGVDGDLLNLKIVPRPQRGSVSISHCHEVGGFALDRSSGRIGFDLEVIARTRPELVQRVSTAEEFNAAPSSAALWTAKEASYKCLPFDKQPLTAKEIWIGDWRASDMGWEFTARLGDEVLRGSCWLITEAVMAALVR